MDAGKLLLLFAAALRLAFSENASSPTQLRPPPPILYRAPTLARIFGLMRARGGCGGGESFLFLGQSHSSSSAESQDEDSIRAQPVGGVGQNCSDAQPSSTVTNEDRSTAALESEHSSAEGCVQRATMEEGGGISAYLSERFAKDARDHSTSLGDSASEPRGHTRGSDSVSDSSSPALPDTVSRSASEHAREDVAVHRRNIEESTDDRDSSEEAEAERLKRKRPLQAVVSKEKAPEYQDTRPMVCKEFAEKGWCRYGVTCIFLHDRAAYYDKWKEKVREQKRRARQASRQASAISEHCPICKDSYTEPVVTQCGHYFCSFCIIQRYESAYTSTNTSTFEGQDGGQGIRGEGEKDEDEDEDEDEGGGGGVAGVAGGGGRNCPLCNKSLNGIFDLAYDLQERLNKQLLPTHAEEESDSEQPKNSEEARERQEYEENLALLGL